MGASLALAGDRLYTCAPRKNSDFFQTLMSVTGECFVYGRNG